MKKFEYVEKSFIEQIQSGKLKPGDKLPDMPQLCNLYQVSHITIQKALTELQQQGYVERIKCKGTFVLERPETEEKKAILAMVISVIERDDTSLLNIIKGAQKEAADRGFAFLLEITDGTHESETKAINTFIQKQVDGLLLYLNHEEIANQLLNGLEEPKIFYIMLDHYDNAFPCNSVTPNNIDGGFMAAKYLIRHGHRRIAYIAYNIMRNTENDRYKGFCNALQAYGIRTNSETAFDESEEKLEKLQKLIKSRQITAVFAVNDRVAMMLLNYLFSCNIRVPEDCSIVGFDDTFESRYAVVPLTTIRQDFKDIGTSAVAMASEAIAAKDEKRVFKKIFLPVRLIERKSVLTIPS